MPLFGRGLPRGQSGRLKAVLLVVALAIVIGMLLYSQRIIRELLDHERKVADLYAKSYEYISSDRSTTGDFSFLFDEVIRTVDFPVILTDSANTPLYPKNIPLDSTLTQAQRNAVLKTIMEDMDRQNKPIRIALNDTLVLNYVHYGESRLISQLRWLPFIEIALATIFVFIAYIGFSFIKRSEQSNIWVGMARETAHQLGTPLSSMMGWVEMLREGAARNKNLLDVVDEMQQDVERLNKVAARFSKIGSKPDLKEESLNDIIEGVIRYIARRIPKTGKKVDLFIETSTPCTARVNRELFEWVIENLMKNALDAMEGPSGKISFALSQTGTRAIIDVTDTGKGIDPRIQKEIFRPGFSTKKRGWGLGLSLSKRIIEEYHTGKLSIRQSTVGAGTTFRIRLKR